MLESYQTLKNNISNLNFQPLYKYLSSSLADYSLKKYATSLAGSVCVRCMWSAKLMERLSINN